MDNQTRRNDSGTHTHEVQRRSSRQIEHGVDLHAIREFNRLLILNHIREHGPLARVMIAQRLGLSRTTVSSIIDVLMNEGIVREGSLLNAAPQGGRRAILVHFEEDAGRVIGIDIGRSHLTLIITDLAATVLSQKTLPFNTDHGAEHCMLEVIQLVRLFTSEVELNWSRVIGIGVGIPGPLDNECHRISRAPHMPGWENIDLWQILQQEFRVPIWIDRDANMGAIGEYRGGAGQKHTDLAYIKIGTGIGAGLLLNGDIYRGHSGSAGEVGHLTIQENGIQCSCGNRGCLETVAVAPLIVADADQGLTLSQKQSAHLSCIATTHPTDQSSRANRAGRPKKNLADVLQSAREGDLASLAALEQAGEHIGVALAGLINIFNPSAVIIDGGIAHPDEIFLHALQRSAVDACLPSAWEGTHIIAAELGTLSVALGATYTVIDATFNQQKVIPAVKEAQ